MQNTVGSENSLVFTRNTFALQKINGTLNSSLDRCWFLALLSSYLGGRCGWLHVVKICAIKKNFRCGARADKFWCIIFRATRVRESILSFRHQSMHPSSIKHTDVVECSVNFSALNIRKGSGGPSTVRCLS